MTQDPIEDPVRAARELAGEVASLRRAFNRRTHTLVAGAVVFGVVVGLAVVLVVRAQAENDRRIDESNQRWCPMVELLVPKPGEAPPTTQRSAQIAARAAELARQFHCTPVP